MSSFCINDLNKDFLFDVARITEDAGHLIMRYFRGSFEKSHKLDGSPVTTADREADFFIQGALKSLVPTIPVVSEEGHQDHKNSEFFWLVDPVDGTSQFARGKEEFTVNIALVHNNKPILGVIYHPPSQKMYAALGGDLYLGNNTSLMPVNTETASTQAVVIGNMSEKNTQFKNTLIQHDLHHAEIHVIPSSLKFCFMAEGNACFQYRARPSSEWDTAAGHALIMARGGNILTLSGAPLIYGKEDYRNPGFIAFLPR